MQPLTAERLVSEVRVRISDTGARIFTSNQILEAADLCFGPVWDTVRLAGEDHELDRMDIEVSDLTTVEDSWGEYTLPEWVGTIRRIEGLNGTSRPTEFDASNLDKKDVPRAAFYTWKPRWFRSGQGRSGKISIMGGVSSYTGIRIWYVRRYPILHYGTAQNGGTTSTMVFTTSPTGAVVRRNDLYIGLDVYFTGATNTDQIRRITDYVASTNTATLDSAVGVAIGSSQTYSLVFPLEQEHSEYFIEVVTRALLRRLANSEHLFATERHFTSLEERFKASLGARDQGRPKRLWHTRR